MRTINEIIIHCSATAPDWMPGASTAARVEEIRRWHKDRGWKDIGYHYVIDRDGTVAQGRHVSVAGAHVKGRNAHSIGICLLGGKGSNENDQFADNYTAAQDRALRQLLQELARRYGAVPIRGHNDYAAKACPGFRVDQWLPRPVIIDEPVHHDDPAEQGGLIAAIVAVLREIFGGRK